MLNMKVGWVLALFTHVRKTDSRSHHLEQDWILMKGNFMRSCIKSNQLQRWRYSVTLQSLTMERLGQFHNKITWKVLPVANSPGNQRNAPKFVHSPFTYCLELIPEFWPKIAKLCCDCSSSVNVPHTAEVKDCSRFIKFVFFGHGEWRATINMATAAWCRVSFSDYIQ